MNRTSIQWTEYSWNPVTGCSTVSEGCTNCYARRMAQRLRGRFGYPADDPFRVTLHPERLEEPLRWRKPRMVFVCSMADLFHDDVPDDFIDRVFATMALCPQHIFQVLTKRPERMCEYITAAHTSHTVLQHWKPDRGEGTWPLPNVWLGVTAEDQLRADERIPMLLETSAAVRFVSVEPMLGPVDLTNVQFDRYTRMNVLEGCGISARSPAQSIPNAFCDRLNWVICGSETGPNRRPANIEWVRRLRDQCVSSGVPFFLKQMEIGNRVVKMPELDDQVWAQFPEVCHAS